MGFKNGCYATAWTDKQEKTVVKIYERYATVSMTTSKKKQDGTYETDFNNKVRFLGKAFEKIKTLALGERDRLHLLEVEVTTRYDRAKQSNYTNFICWDFEPAEMKNNNTRQPEVVTGDTKLQSFDTVDAELPF